MVTCNECDDEERNRIVYILNEIDFEPKEEEQCKPCDDGEMEEIML